MNDIGTTSPYLSILFCVHDHAKLVNAYVNGQPIGSIKDGVFSPHAFSHSSGSPIPVRLTQIPKPFPFETMDEFKDFMDAVIDKLQMVEEPRDLS